MTINYMNLFFNRIAKDLKQKELLPIKIVFFVQTSTILVLYPYLTIHMRELGINVEETAIMSAVTPVVGILMPPVAGMIADKIGNFRILLSIFSLLGGVSALLLLLVPVGRVTITYPNDVILGVSCNPGSNLSLSLFEDVPCSSAEPYLTRADVKIRACGLICQANENFDQTILKSTRYGLQFHDLENRKTSSYTYTLTDDDINFEPISSETKNHQTRKNNERFTTSIRKLSKNSYFFPAAGVFNFSCAPKQLPDLIQNDTYGNYNCLYGTKDKLNELGPGTNTLKLGVSLNPLSGDDILEQRKLYTVQHIENTDGTKSNSTCLDGLQRNDHISVNLPTNSTNGNMLDLGSCALRCIGTSPRKQFCSNKNTEIEYDVSLTFWSYLAIRVFLGIIGGTAYTMFEGAVIASLREYKADYGLQRLYALIGGMISSPLSGWMIDFFSEGKGYTDFRPVFYLYAILKSLSAVLILFINLEFKSPAASVVSDVLALMNIELISLFTACFLMGSAWGYIESFLFWLIQDLGGSKSLMGLTITVGGILGIPLLVLSGLMVKKIGHANIIFIGFIAYAIRLLGYSIIYNPWYSLIFEAMECFTHSLCFTAAITYAAKLSTPTTDSTIQGIFGGLFYGVGRSFGSLVGGYLIKLFGIRQTFQIFSIATGIAGILYLAFYHLYMKKRSALLHPPQENEKDKEKGLRKEEIDITKSAINGHFEEKPVNLPYEDAVTNMAYEEGEEENQDPNNVPNVQVNGSDMKSDEKKSDEKKVIPEKVITSNRE